MHGFQWHVKSAPYHPATNGEAERFIQTFKNTAGHQDEGTLEQKLSQFLMVYLITPHMTDQLGCPQMSYSFNGTFGQDYISQQKTMWLSSMPSKRGNMIGMHRMPVQVQRGSAVFEGRSKVAAIMKNV